MSSGSSALSQRRREELRVLSFPQKLHMLLRDAEAENLQHVASWNAEGTGFTIHNKYFFEAHIIPKYFNSSQYRAFQRSLNVWGFSVVSKGPHRGTCWHPYFRKDREDLCEHIDRVPIKSSGKKPSDTLSFDDIGSLQLPPRKPTFKIGDGNADSASSPDAAREDSQAQVRDSEDAEPAQAGLQLPSIQSMPSSIASFPASSLGLENSERPDSLRLLQRLLASQSLTSQAMGIQNAQTSHLGPSIASNQQQESFGQNHLAPSIPSRLFQRMHHGSNVTPIVSQTLLPQDVSGQILQRLLPSFLASSQSSVQSDSNASDKAVDQSQQLVTASATSQSQSASMTGNAPAVDNNAQAEQISALLQSMSSTQLQGGDQLTNLLQQAAAQQLLASQVQHLNSQQQVQQLRQSDIISLLAQKFSPIQSQNIQQPPQDIPPTSNSAVLQMLTSSRVDPATIALLLQLLQATSSQQPPT